MSEILKEADYAAIELRLLAHYGEEANKAPAVLLHDDARLRDQPLRGPSVFLPSQLDDMPYYMMVATGKTMDMRHMRVLVDGDAPVYLDEPSPVMVERIKAMHPAGKTKQSLNRHQRRMRASKRGK